MRELLILRGIQGSGKTTYAKELCENNPTGWIRINRDDIRNSCGKYWVPQREDLITSFENQMAETALRCGYNIVIDATNLNNRDFGRWNKLKVALQKDNIHITMSTKEFKVSLNKAIWRNFYGWILGKRKYVPIKVIKRFYYKYNESLK